MKKSQAVLLALLAAVIAGALGAGLALAIADDHDASPTRSSTNSELPEDPEATEQDTEPSVTEPSPDGEYQAGCDYLLGDQNENSADGYRFTADASVDNTGNVGTVYELSAEWYLSGGDSIKATKRVRIRPGMSGRIGIVKPATGDQIDAHQSYSGGDSCKAEVSIVNTFGVPE